jgi:group I intron endonuclease
MKAYIYLITNLINDKVYVGKSINPDERWRHHKNIAAGGKEKYPKEFSSIHGAIRKYGEDNFGLKIVEEFDTEDEAYRAETRWIISLVSNDRSKGYNLNLGGKGGIQPTEEVRQKLIAAQNTDEKLKLCSEQMKQRHIQNPGFLGKINAGNQYALGLKHSDETKKKISGEKGSAAKLTNVKVLEIREKYSSGNYTYSALAREYGVYPKTIRSIVLRKSWKLI